MLLPLMVISGFMSGLWLTGRAVERKLFLSKLYVSLYAGLESPGLSGQELSSAPKLKLKMFTNNVGHNVKIKVGP